MKKSLSLIFFFLIIFSSLVFAEGENSFGENVNVRNEVVQNHIQTRNVVKNHIDAKSDQLITEVTKTAQGFINKNFVELDKRIQGMINTFLLKILIGLVSCIVFSQLLWYVIKRRIQKIQSKKELLRNGK